MKRRRKRINKSREIREYKRLHPGAGPTEIAERLAERRIKVTPSQVGTALYNARKLKRRSRRAMSAATNGRRRRRSTLLSADLLLAAKSAVDQLGGIDRVRSALELLEKLR